MPVAVKVAAAIIAGFLVGSVFNMGVVLLGTLLIPPPPGVDFADPASVAQARSLLTPVHFIFPWLAHAGGTFVGILMSSIVYPPRAGLCAMVLGVLFLAGGIAASVMIPAPAVFIALDLVLAYLPMAWLGYRVARHVRPGRG